MKYVSCFLAILSVFCGYCKLVSEPIRSLINYLEVYLIWMLAQILTSLTSPQNKASNWEIAKNRYLPEGDMKRNAFLLFFMKISKNMVVHIL